MPRKRYVSPTQLDMLGRCGEAYRRRYMEKEIIPPGVAMVSGGAVHKAAAENFRQKKGTRKDLLAEEIIEIADASFSSEAERGVWLSPDEKARGQKVVVEDARELTRDLAGVHADDQAPDYQPDLIEHKHEIELPGKFNLFGVMDLADDKGRVVDFKTGQKAKSQGDADVSIQLTAYSAMYQSIKGGVPPTDIRFDTAIRTKTKTDRQVLSTSRNQADLDALAARINAAAKIIQAGLFMPTSPDNWACSANWCGYHATCPFVNRGRARQGD